MNNLEEKIKEIEYGLPENIRQVQILNLPSIININLTQKNSYKYNGNTYTVDGNKKIFLTNDLPIKSMKNKVPIFNKSLLSAVDESLIHPFILFINNKAIKWSDIEIVSDVKYTYIIIDNILDSISSVSAIRIPYRVRYGEDNITNINYKGNFYFDSNGLLTTNINNIVMRIEIISPYLNCITTDYSNGYIEVVADSYNKPATPENIITFTNGELINAYDLFSNIGYNIFTYDGDPTNTIFKTFYYVNGNACNGNEYKLDSNIIKNDIINGIFKPYSSKLRENLSLKMPNILPSSQQVCPDAMTGIAVAQITDNKFLVCYKNDSTKNGRMFAVEFFGNRIKKIGYIYTFNIKPISTIMVVKKVNESGKFIIGYSSSTNSSLSTLIVTINDDLNITLGIGASIELSTTISNFDICKINDNKFMVCYSRYLDSWYGTAVTITFSNNYTSYTLSDKHVFASEEVTNIKTEAIDNTVCLCYLNSAKYGISTIIGIDDLGINIGTKYIFNSDTLNYLDLVKISDDTVLLAYISTLSKLVTYQLLNIKGSIINILPQYVFDSINQVNTVRMQKMYSDSIFVVQNSSNISYYGIMSIDNNAISYNYIDKFDNTDFAEYKLVSSSDCMRILYSDIMNMHNGYVYSFYNYYNEINAKIKKIMSYNPELLDSIYNDLAPFENSIYTGEEIINKLDVDGYLTMPRRRYNNIFCYVILFVNGELYEKYDTISYINDKFKILIGTNITNQDNIEILFIKNANNNIGAISISSSDESILLNSEFNEKNIKLFSTEYSSRIYQLDTGITPSYNIPFITIDNGDNNYSITLNDSFYYNKVLDVVHNNIFRYKKFIMEYNQIDVKLGDDFKYCINKNNYIIFINGRIIDNKNFEIAIPSCDNPFDQVVAYINIIMSPLDEVEVFYLPFEVTDAYTSASIPTNADISIGSYLPFNLSKNRYWYFINGKKISPNNINNISDNRINIRSDYASIYNFTVMQYMNSIDIISSLLSVNDNWNSIISLLGSDLTLFYDHINFTNTETDIKINETDMKATILEAVAQYYSKYISNTAFIYDFNDIVFDGKDSANNNIINLLNANINNRVDVDR
jgi:hypothetical protein